MNHPVVSHDKIEKIAGKLHFQLGLEDSKSLPIVNFQFEQAGAKAIIDGFSVEVQYLSKSVEGKCNCPDSEGFDFCRHCVCLLVHANKALQQIQSLSKGPDKSKILAYLLKLDKQGLAQQCLELIEQDNEHVERFLLRASLNNDPIDFGSLKQRVTFLTRTTDKLFSQRQVKHFFQRINRFLEELVFSNYQSKPEQMVKIIEYAFQRINLLLIKIDDNSEQRSECIEKLRDIYRDLIVLLAARTDTKVKKLYTLWLNDRYQLLGTDIRFYTDSIDGLYEKFIQHANKQWHNGNISFNEWQSKKLAKLLLEEAIAQSCLEDEQEFRTFLATTPEDWLKIAERWSGNRHDEKATQILYEKLDQYSQHSEMLQALVQLYQKNENTQDALLDLFQYNPAKVAPYLFESARNAQQLDMLQKACIGILQQRNQTDEVELLLQLFLQQQCLKEASVLATNFELSLESRILLGQNLKTSDPQQSINLLKKTILELLQKQRQKCDYQAAELYAELSPLLESTHENSQNFLLQLRPLIQNRPSAITAFQNVTTS